MKKKRYRPIYLFIFILSLIIPNMFLFSNNATGQSQEGSFTLNGSLVVGHIKDLSYFPDGRHIALAAHPLPMVVNLTSLKIEYSLNGQSGKVTTIDTTSNIIVTGSEDGSLFLWNRNGELQNSIIVADDSILKVRMNENGTKVAIMTARCRVLLYSVPDFEQVWMFTLRGAEQVYPPGLEWSPDDRYIGVVNGGPGLYVSVLSAETGEEEFTIHSAGSSGAIYGLTWKWDSQYIAVIFDKDYEYHMKNIEIWDVSTRMRINYLYGYTSDTYSVGWLSGSDLLVSGCGEDIILWHANLSEFQRITMQHKEFHLISTKKNGLEFAAYAHSTETLFIFTWSPDAHTERPNVFIEEPPADSVQSVSVKVTGIAWGMKPITEIRIRIDNEDWHRGIGTSTWEATLDISYLSVGDHVMTALSFDGEYYSEPHSILFKVEAQTSDYKLSIGFSSPEEYSVLPSGNNSIQGYFYAPNLPDPELLHIAIDNGPWFDVEPKVIWRYRWDTASVEDGRHILYARGYDGMKWSSIASLVVETRNGGEGSPIYVTIDHPLEGQEVEGVIEVQGRSKLLSGTVNVSIELNDDGEWLEVEGNTNWNYTLNTTMFQNGPLSIMVKATNGVNETVTTTRNIVVKNGQEPMNLPPNIFITSPKNDAVIERLTEIKGTASDDKGVTKVQVRIDDGKWYTADGTNDWNFDASETGLKGGLHTIEARSYDGGQYSKIRSILVMTERSNDNKPPKTPSSQESKLSLLIILIVIVVVLLIILTNFFRGKNIVEPKSKKISTKKRRK